MRKGNFVEVIKNPQALIHEADGFRLVAGSMSRLLAVTEKERSSAGELVDAILKQVSLTERLLNLADAVGLRSAFTQSISTVQGSALLLGSDHVRRIAVMLTAYDGISRIGADSKAWLQEFQVALTAVELSRLLSTHPGFGMDEECATVTSLRGISRIPTACADERVWRHIVELAERTGQAVDCAAKHELGLSYSSSSQGAVNAWRFPEHTYQRVAPVSSHVERLGSGYSAWVQAVSACAYDVAECLLMPEAQGTQRLRAVQRNFASVTPGGLATLPQLLEQASTQAEETCKLLGFGDPALPIASAVSHGTPKTPREDAASTAQRARAITSSLVEIAVAASRGKPRSAIFNIAVEGLARCLNATRATLVLRNDQEGAYEAVASHGTPLALSKCKRFPAKFAPDVVSAVVASGRDFVAADPAKVKGKLPDWCRAVRASEKGEFLLSLSVLPRARAYRVLLRRPAGPRRATRQRFLARRN
jgi:hypothetical protein